MSRKAKKEKKKAERAAKTAENTLPKVSDGKVLALYDFSAKQNFIYRTSKIKEISGASALLSGIYKKFVSLACKNSMDIKYDLDTEFDIKQFRHDGEVLYDGGGNLMILFKNIEKYKEFNNVVSVWLMKEVPTLQLIACCVPFTGNFGKDRAALYRKNSINKNLYPMYDLTAVTPFTQVDPLTFLPVVHKDKEKEISQSADRYRKEKAYYGIKDKNNDLDNLDGMAAVIYIDGNSMGQKLMNCLPGEDAQNSYNEGVKMLRRFSADINNTFVDAPMRKLEEGIKNSPHKGYRRVIGGGDEITIICNAKIALKLTQIYFESLKESNQGKSEKEKNYACAGIAVFHAKAPFTVAYEIAEAACESAKELAHKTNGNYIDFHYCHAGVTADFKTLRKREQSVTARPYSFDEAMEAFANYTPLLQSMGRSNVKALGDAAQLGKADYLFEAERVNAYLSDKGKLITNEEKSDREMKLIFDMSEFYDLWFGKEEKANEKADEDSTEI